MTPHRASAPAGPMNHSASASPKTGKRTQKAPLLFCQLCLLNHFNPGQLLMQMWFYSFLHFVTSQKMADFSPNEAQNNVGSCSFPVASEEPASAISSSFPETLSPFSPELFWLWETISCEPVPMETCRRPRPRCAPPSEERRCSTTNDQTEASVHLLFEK